MSQEAKEVIQAEAAVEEKPEAMGKDKAVLPTPAEIEKIEEQKLKSKFPAFAQGRGGGQSAFLQKRVGAGQKYFDSGDYEMAKQRGPMGRAGPKKGQLRRSTGEEHPSPDTVPAKKSPSIKGTQHSPGARTKLSPGARLLWLDKVEAGLPCVPANEISVNLFLKQDYTNRMSRLY